MSSLILLQYVYHNNHIRVERQLKAMALYKDDEFGRPPALTFNNPIRRNQHDALLDPKQYLAGSDEHGQPQVIPFIEKRVNPDSYEGGGG